MSVRNLDKLLRPASVAVFGASPKPDSLGHIALSNLQRAPYQGRLLLVNPRHRELAGLPVYKDVASLPEAPDLAIIATPPATVPGIIAELGARGTRAAVVLGTAFGALDNRGRHLVQAALDAARPYLLRIVGPHSVGLMTPSLGLDASCSPAPALAGDLAFISQSAAMATAVLDWAQPRRIGFSHVVSLGDMADVDFADLIDHLGADVHTRAILLYVEGITAARKFMSAARAAARSKPVVAVKAARFAESLHATRSHAGVLAGSDAVYEAAFRRAGMLRVTSMSELFDAVETLSATKPQTGERLAIVTNGGGPGVLATDALLDQGGRLATLAPATLQRLDAVLPAGWSRDNPIDIVGDAPPQRFSDTLKILLEDRNVDAILLLNAPSSTAEPVQAAQAVIDTVKATPRWQMIGRNVLTAWLGDGLSAPARRLFAEAHVATYSTPDGAVRGFRHRVRYHQNQELLMETPAARPDHLTPDRAIVRAIIDRALQGGRSELDADEIAVVLSAYGIPGPELRLVKDVDEAVAAAAEIGWPVALKIHSPDIDHKTDVGGVAINLGNATRVRNEAQAMLARVATARPEARLGGFIVQAMVARPGAVELIVGIVGDPVFGPLVMFGQGGTMVEFQRDWTLELPPLNESLAHAQIARTRVAQLLGGYRGQPPVDIEAVIDTLLLVAQLAIDHPAVRSFEINPLVADARGVMAVDARLSLARPKARGPTGHLAISPYPQDLEAEVGLPDGTRLFLRPIRPEDEPMIQDMAHHMTPDDMRLRFFTPLRDLPHQLAARLTQIDYDREMALIAFSTDHGTALGVARYAADPDNARAEYGVAVRSDWKGRGLGYLLMTRLIDLARARGIGALVGEVLRENEPMLQMCRDLGFVLTAQAEDHDVLRVTKPLHGAGDP